MLNNSQVLRDTFLALHYSHSQVTNMIHSLAFGRVFWLDLDNELMSAPWLKDGTVLDGTYGTEDQSDYVSEWTDLEGINLSSLLNIHRDLLLRETVK